MLPKIIFCTAVCVATIAVILLALISPIAHRKPERNHHTRPWLALSLYIQQPNTTNLDSSQPATAAAKPETRAFVFHHTLTEGPENTSRIVGKAQGFIIPIEHFAHSAFNIIYLSFDTPGYSGSLSVQAKHVTHKYEEELMVVGGTGSFAFARGLAVFAQRRTGHQPYAAIAMYHLKLRLRFPNQAPTIPG